MNRSTACKTLPAPAVCCSAFGRIVPVAPGFDAATLWVYLGDAAHPYNVFDFTVNRKRDGPQ